MSAAWPRAELAAELRRAADKARDAAEAFALRSHADQLDHRYTRRSVRFLKDAI